MAVHVVRQSKVRHVFCQPEKRDLCYDGVRITKVTWDSLFCAVNPKFIAIVTEAAGGGAFMVLPANKPGKVEKDYPLVSGHRAAVLDIQWCPFNDNVIASASEDTTIKVWQIPDGGPTTAIVDPVVSLERHEKRVGIIQWHPSANNILLSAGSDTLVVIWNVGTGEVLKAIQVHPDLLFSCEWNYDGSKLVTTCKDKMIRVIDPRSGEVIEEGKGHEGSKPQRAIWLRDGHIFTTGFSRMSERQYALRSDAMIHDPIINIDLDSSNGVLIPIYDSDLSMIYLIGKGDSAIRYFEINMQQAPYVHYVNTYSSSEPQRGLGLMPKRGLDISLNEINRFYKLHGKGLVEPLKMICPRKSDLFQADLFPEARSDQPALSADEWFVEKLDKDPLLISLKGGYQSKQTQQLQVAKKKPNVLDKMPSKAGDGQAPGAGADAAAAESSAVVEALKNEVRMLKRLLIAQDRRIEALESKCGLTPKSERPTSSPSDNEAEPTVRTNGSTSPKATNGS